jgi:hypothetical protein
MADKFPPSKQRAALKRLAVALNSTSALQTDACGDPCIRGQYGHAYAVCGTVTRPKAPGFTLYLDCPSARAWTAAKKALGFAEVTGDGDEDGWFFLDRLPTTPEEATTIRRYLGISKRREVSAETKARLALTRKPFVAAKASPLTSHVAGKGSHSELLPSNTQEART